MNARTLVCLTALLFTGVFAPCHGAESGSPPRPLYRMQSRLLTLSIPAEPAPAVESVTAGRLPGQTPADTASATIPASAPNSAPKPFLDLSDAQTVSDASVENMSATNRMFEQLAVWTIIILCLSVLTVLGLRRWQRRQGLLPEGHGQSKILETLAIGPGRAVSLVQLGDVRAIVGTDGGGIQSIVLAPPAFDEELQLFDHEDDAASPDSPAA